MYLDVKAPKRGRARKSSLKKHPIFLHLSSYFYFFFLTTEEMRRRRRYYNQQTDGRYRETGSLEVTGVVTPSRSRRVIPPTPPAQNRHYVVACVCLSVIFIGGGGGFIIMSYHRSYAIYM